MSLESLIGVIVPGLIMSYLVYALLLLEKSEDLVISQQQEIRLAVLAGSQTEDGS